MKKYLLPAALCFAISVFASDYTETRTMVLPIDGLRNLEIEAGAGELIVAGKNGISEIRVTAAIEIEHSRRSDGKEIADRELELYLERNGSTALLVSKTRDRHSFFDSYPNITVNLTVEIPSGLKIYVEDGAGDIKIENTEGDVEIDDGSGFLEIKNTKGDVEIHDGSGALSLHNIEGNLNINDGSGRIRAEKISGNVDIDDGSGSIVIENITGSVYISDDGSGSVEIDGVGKDVTIRDSGTGGVHISNVNGTIRRHDD